MQEIELKFQVPAGRRAAVDAAVAGRDAVPRQRLQAVYFDTDDRALARAGMALRIRREGRRWIQTLKAAGDDGLTRAEHNVPLPAPGAEAPAAVDVALHDGTPAGERLRAVLGDRTAAALSPLYRTDVRRRSRQLRTRLGVVELAFDEGAIIAGERRLPVCELEIELVSGAPLAVVDAARRWVLRHGLWLDTRSKAERGDLLARGVAFEPARKAGDVALDDDMTWSEGRRAVLLSCLRQIAVNGSQVASGVFDDEHLHQLRVGLRRLRTALRIFASADTAELALQAAVLFRRCGAARDRVAIGAPLERQLADALASAGLAFAPPPLPPTDVEAEPAALMRLGPAQSLLLELYALTQQPPAPPGAEAPALRDTLVHRLDRWQRKVRADAKRFDKLADVARHTMRKRAKSLRYGIEFAAGLFKRHDVERTLKRLRRLQDCLGAIVDVDVAIDAYRGHSESDPHVLFALGWLAARRVELLRRAGPALDAFADAPRIAKA